jgi:hypothetical protein
MRRVEKVVLVLAGITIGACATEAVSTAVRTAHAQAGPRCDYSSIIDSGTPELGRGGAVSYGGDWEAMVAGGWRLKAGAAGIYIFERCTPPSP